MSGQKLAARSVKRPREGGRKRKKPSEEQQEAKRSQMRRAYSELTPAERTLERWRKYAKPPVPRQGSKRGENPRHVALAQAFCDWSDLDEVVRMCVAAAVMAELTGRTYVLAHTVPLNHPLVCGLHTHTNIRVVTNELNALEGNWIWPQMWPHDESTVELLEQLAEQQREDRLQAANDHEPTRVAPPKRRGRRA